MKNILILLLLIGFSFSAEAQKQDKIKAVKTAFITEALNLSSAEAEKFWPIYNAHEDKLDALRKKKRTEIYKNIQEGIDNMNEGEANNLLNKSLEFKSAELQYETELIEELRKIISPKKVIKLQKAEYDFRKKLLERFKRRKGDKKE